MSSDIKHDRSLGRLTRDYDETESILFLSNSHQLEYYKYYKYCNYYIYDKYHINCDDNDYSHDLSRKYRFSKWKYNDSEYINTYKQLSSMSNPIASMSANICASKIKTDGTRLVDSYVVWGFLYNSELSDHYCTYMLRWLIVCMSVNHDFVN